MTGSVVARRYAKALFALEYGKGGVKGRQALEKCGNDLAALVFCLDASPDLEKLFRNPVFTPEEKQKVLTALAEKASLGKTVKNFVFILADKGRLGYLRNIAAQFQTMLDAEKGIVRGEFVSAVTLSDKKRQELLATLEKKAGRSLALEFKVDPALLGGMLLRVGDTMQDASLNTQLSLLTDTIKRGE